MSYLLHIETSGLTCSVCVSYNTEIKGFKENLSQTYKHSEVLHLLVGECLKEAGINFENIEAVSVSIGPGSYTGLRVGVSAAKGYAFALQIPIIAIPTLKLIAKSGQTKLKSLGKSCESIIAMIDARREEVFCQEFDMALNEKTATSATILTEVKSQFKNVLFCGNGAEKAKKYFSSDNIFFAESYAQASNMIDLAYQKFSKKEFEDTAYFEPFYLKEFYTKK